MTQFPQITLWIEQLKAGDSTAAQGLWEVYFRRMVELARRKLEGAARTVADEEDVALSAFKSFCLGAREGRFTQLVDRDNLWPLLMAITANKSVDLIRGQNRHKRGGTGSPSDDRDLAGTPLKPVAVSASDLISKEPTPEFTAELSDNLHRLVAKLDMTGDGDLRRIALLKMEGYTTKEIAEQFGCVGRTVERKLQLIKRLWEKGFES